MHWHDLARHQAGAIARDQLLECGVSEAAIRGLVERDELRELAPCVYAPRPVPGSRRQQFWVAVLWSGGGVLSHRSAAGLWQIPTSPTSLVHLTVGDRRYRKIPSGTRPHRVGLASAECATVDGLPVTNRERTVLDLMRTEHFGAARDLRDRALQQGWLTDGSIARSVRAQLGRTGNVQLRRLYDELQRGAQSEAERLLHSLLRRAGLRGWRAQYRVRLGVRTAYVDVAFPEARLAIEVDGRRHHGDASARFEDDRDRQNVLVLAGWRVVRVTWRMLTERPDRVRDQIVQLLAA